MLAEKNINYSEKMPNAVSEPDYLKQLQTRINECSEYLKTLQSFVDFCKLLIVLP